LFIFRSAPAVAPPGRLSSNAFNVNFGIEFKTEYDGFRKLVLSTARNINDHRTGSAPITVTVIGRFGRH
jgi:hypothetical protein